jgi:uncharacterized membrane protein
MTRRLFKAATLWLYGGFVYYLIELAWRGHSHPSMFVLGGVCLLVLGGLNNWFPWTLGLLWQSLIGAAVITALELVTGIVVNLWLNLGVWDYQHMPLNLYGQICVPFIAAWVPLAAFAIVLDDWLRHWVFGEVKPMYKFV